MVVTLDKVATEEIARRHRGRMAPAMFILITLEGELRRSKTPMPRDFSEGPHHTDKWEEAKKLAFQEAIVIYNTRSKKASRPVWPEKVEISERKLSGHCWESVRLIPHQPTLDRFFPNLRTARLFRIE